jgi:hypothetical protein
MALGRNSGAQVNTALASDVHSTLFSYNDGLILFLHTENTTVLGP